MSFGYLYIFWRKFYLHHFSIFCWVMYLFLSIVGVQYVYWILGPFGAYGLQIFSPFLLVVLILPLWKWFLSSNRGDLSTNLRACDEGGRDHWKNYPGTKELAGTIFLTHSQPRYKTCKNQVNTTVSNQLANCASHPFVLQWKCPLNLSLDIFPCFFPTGDQHGPC